MELARGVLIAGKYRLERPLASGGMGSVWVARHAQLDTQAAVKFMDPASSSSAVARARFEREAKASATLRNKHVVHVLDYGVEGDQPYLVMELLQGEDLSKRLHRERRLTLAAASQILTQAARGLRTAHEARVVHRDLKPANIFLTRAEDEDGEIVKVLDFGIAKDFSTTPVGEATKTGELMGSPHYMSPEQVRGVKDIDHRSDLWSLSVITFRAITGKMPFGGENIGAVIAQILADPIPIATRVAPDLPPEVDAFFARGFARDRDQRFQTAREMAEAFAAIAGNAEANARWSVVEEPPTRPRMPSSYPIDTVADLGPPSSVAMDAPSVATEAMSLPSPTIAPTPVPASSAFGGTGGPVIHTAPPPPPPRASLLRWLPLAGAGAGVLIGAVAFFAVGPSAGNVSAQPGTAGSEVVTAASQAAPIPSAVPAPAGTMGPPHEGAPNPGASPAAPTVSASASAGASTSATAKATAKPKETAAPAKPAAPAPPPPPPSKKKPNWGF